MQTIRTTIDSERLATIIDLPASMRHREVEVIVLPIDDAPSGKGTVKLSDEEFDRFLLSGPVADGESVRMQEEFREEMRRWTQRSW